MNPTAIDRRTGDNPHCAATKMAQVNFEATRAKLGPFPIKLLVGIQALGASAFAR